MKHIKQLFVVLVMVAILFNVFVFFQYEKNITKLNKLNYGLVEDMRIKDITSDIYKDSWKQCYSELNKTVQKYNELNIKHIQEYNSWITKEQDYLTDILYFKNTNDYLYRVNNVSVFTRAVKHIANANEYQVDVYDCTEFSRDLTDKLNGYGWDAEQTQVVVDCDFEWFDTETCEQFDGRHDIVKVKEVYIEATSGHIIMPQYYKEYGIRT